MLLRVSTILSCLAASAGCAAPAFEQPPTLTEVWVSVTWSTNEQIRQRCGYDKIACATVGQPNVPYSRIWTEKPLTLTDSRRICSLGHEFMHSLGADHKH